ncbi:TPA: type II toxin-antitoxin system RelE/ParE family toxin, partial [Escherichia coli]|nr:type II toxin-antitoxin system RelE/ParE family toxin [Escherichia coli]HBA9668692.1 type II toxin-antitoxin system RelE/ParE family toxin [Escherichia coli]
YGRYLLLFRVLDTEVRIERIVHGSRDINRVLAEPDDKPSDHFWQL